MRLRSKVAQIALGCGGAALFMFLLVIPVLPQTAGLQHKGVPEDWSHHRLVFSNPGTFQDAMKRGTYNRWVRIVTDPRFHQQQLRRKATQWRATQNALDDPHIPHGPVPLISRFLQRDWSMDLGSNGSVGADQYPAKFSFDVDQASCDSASQPDFVVFNTNLAGSGSQPSIIAYDNLYSGCGGITPLVYFQYDTDGGVIPTSITLAEDGIQMAFVQNNAGVASLVILKSQRNVPGENASLVTLSNSDPANYRTCNAPCMTELPLEGGASVTFAAPFYDYADDVLYLGDDSGQLHKFQNIFVSGTPSEVTGGDNNSGWPQNISEAIPGGGPNALTSAVYDGVTGNVFVAIVATYNNQGGFTAYIPSTGGSDNIVYSSQLANTSGYGFVDSPLVDSTAATVYDFADIDKTPSPGPYSGVFQQTTTFPLLDYGVEEQFGSGNSFQPQIAYDGAFDNIYYSSQDPSNPFGNIYACGRDPSGSYLPTLYQVPIASNAMQTPVAGPTLTVGTADCSPVQEFFNGPTDWIFLSVTDNNDTSSPILCPSGSGCLMSLDVTNPSGFAPTTATYATAMAGSGTSGIIVDNDLNSPAGTSQIYFSTLGDQTCSGNGTTGNGTGGCAIQASQKGLD